MVCAMPSFACTVSRPEIHNRPDLLRDLARIDWERPELAGQRLTESPPECARGFPRP